MGLVDSNTVMYRVRLVQTKARVPAVRLQGKATTSSSFSKLVWQLRRSSSLVRRVWQGLRRWGS